MSNEETRFTSGPTTLQSYYEARAPEYDNIYEKPERQTDLRAIECWLGPRFAGHHVLEIACGTGYWTQFIAPFAASVVGMDSASETLRVAKARVPGENAHFVLGDAYDLSAPVGGFSAVFAGFWFSHVPKAKRREFIRGVHKVLGAGSAVVLLDNLHVVDSSSPIAEEDLDGNTYQIRVLRDGSRHRVLKNFPTEVELRDSVADFAVSAKYTRWQFFWAFEYATGKH